MICYRHFLFYKIVLRLETGAKRYLLPIKNTNKDILFFFTDHDHCTMLEAMQRFYASPVYKELELEVSMFWHLGAVALWEMMR